MWASRRYRVAQQYVAVTFAATALLVFAQDKAGPIPPQENQPDIVSHEATTFKVRVNNVLMRVVVRDAQGNAVGNLTKDNFQIFDNGKPQTMASFSIVGTLPQALPGSKEAKPADATQPVEPQQYFAYLFDDVHLASEELLVARKAAREHMTTTLKTSDRAAVFTTSGRVEVDFTNDGATLLAALDRIHALYESPEQRNTCPWMNHYAANLIVNHNDEDAISIIGQQFVDCIRSPVAPPPQVIEGVVRTTAQRELAKGDADTKLSLSVLRDVIGDLAMKPGQRTLVLVSPGFMAKEEHYFDVAQDLEKALHGNVVINSLDARGLWVDPTAAANTRDAGANAYSQQLRQYMDAGARTESDVLGELADGTGGLWFHDSNDLLNGFRRTATAPEYVYLLSFKPQSLKFDGKFHSLKVVVVNSPGRLEVRTRKGYFAPKASETEAEEARSDIEDAVFSRDERQEIPVDVHTEFYRAASKGNMSVVAHVDLRPVMFRKEAGRNVNTVTVVSVLFDRNGQYIAGLEKKIDFHMDDASLQRHMRTGIVVKSSFAVDPGDYLVRVVVRDGEGQMMSAKNDTVEIP